MIVFDVHNEETNDKAIHHIGGMKEDKDKRNHKSLCNLWQMHITFFDYEMIEFVINKKETNEKMIHHMEHMKDDKEKDNHDTICEYHDQNILHYGDRWNNPFLKYTM